MALTVTSAQDVVRCSLCDNSADYQCKLCQVKLCCDCTSKHLSDKSVKHEVIEFTTQRNLDKMIQNVQAMISTSVKYTVRTAASRFVQNV